MTVSILVGDVREQLRTLESDSIHCVVTSPPYWGLRDYGVDGQIGLEASPAEFIATMVDVFEEVRRVLRPDGTCWINMGDSYASNGGPAGPMTGAQFINRQRSKNAICKANRAGGQFGLKPKDLVMMPHRLAIALQDAGWWVRQDIVWNKPNPMPESVRDRCTKAHEYIFLLSKSERYYYDAEAISEQCSENTNPRRAGNGVGFGHGTDADSRKRGRVKTPAGWATGTNRKHTELTGNFTKDRKLAEVGSGTKNNGSFDAAMAVMPEKRNKRSVWSMVTEPCKEAHFATFPTELPETCIKAGCPPGGIVLDPFFGAGTTGLVADRLQRDCIGIELNPAYAEIARKRIQGESSLLAVVRVAA